MDDAEDADVILHEYGHAVQDDINRYWSGGHTGAMGEGFGDYLAGIYSLTVNPDFQPNWDFNWDGHNQLKDQYDLHARILDQPAAALIRDLRQRGLLEGTLVVWCTEFGRMPMFQKGSKGRDHNPDGFTCWLTGAGIRPRPATA